MKSGITMLIHNKDDIEFVTKFPCFFGHPVDKYMKNRIKHECLLYCIDILFFVCMSNHNHNLFSDLPQILIRELGQNYGNVLSCGLKVLS